MSDLLAELKESWESYKVTERHGLEFGRVCHELHNEYVTKGKREAGKGVQAILQELDIPSRTFYWWRERYMDSQGLKELHKENANATELYRSTKLSKRLWILSQRGSRYY